MLFGAGVQHNVLRNFSAEGLAEALGGPAGAARAVAWAVRLAYLVSVLASFPLQVNRKAPFFAPSLRL